MICVNGVYLRVWYVSHRSVSQKNDNQRAIAYDAHNENYAKNEWHDVGFGTFIVRFVFIAVGLIFTAITLRWTIGWRW